MFSSSFMKFLCLHKTIYILKVNLRASIKIFIEVTVREKCMA